MKVFRYSAVDPDGIPQNGSMQAGTRQQAVNSLRLKNYIVTRLEEEKNVPLSEILTKLRGVPKREIIVFTRQLGTMVGAGLPINQALRILANQTSSKYFAQIVNEIINQIDGGASLHDAIATHEHVFGRLYLSLIKAGESSGNLEEILSRLAATMESEDSFKGKVKGALIYPVIIVFVMIGVMGVMFFFVIPQLAKLYDDLGAELPFMTQIMIDFSRLLTTYWWLMIFATIGAIYGFKQLVKRPGVALKIGQLTIKAPVFGPLLTEVQLTSFTRTLSMLVKSGIPLLEALDISKETLNNVVFRDAAKEAAQQIEKGKPLAEAFRKYKEFPPLMSEMIAVGEQTGKVDEVLDKVSQYFEAQASRKTENLASAIEPIVMVMLGVMVGFLVISLIMPIYSLTSSF